MPETWRDMSLAELANGNAETMFSAALQVVAANIDDPSVPHDAKRTVTLKVDITPVDHERKECDLSVTVTTKIAGRTASGQAWISRDQRGFKVSEFAPTQPPLDYDPPKPTAIEDKEEAK